MKTKEEMLDAARRHELASGPNADLKLAGMQLAVLLDIRDLLAEQREGARTPPIDPARAPVRVAVKEKP